MRTVLGGMPVRQSLYMLKETGECTEMLNFLDIRIPCSQIREELISSTAILKVQWTLSSVIPLLYSRIM
ncbi:hypothetical protein D3C75_788550 [compost metagenome]